MPIRPATTRDARAIARVHVASRRKAYAGFFDPDYLAWLTEPYSMARWIERIQDASGDGSAVLVWSRGESIEGYAHLAPASEAAGEVLQLFVHPDSWRQGVGSALLKACEDLLANAGVSQACLWVFEANLNARSFYEHCGWRPGGESRVVDRGKPLLQVRYVKEVGSGPC